MSQLVLAPKFPKKQL